MIAVLILGVYSVSQLTEPESLNPILTFWMLWLVIDFIIIPFGGLEKRGPKKDYFAESWAGTDMENVATESSPEEPKRGSSKTAKAAFVMSAVALAKSSGPSKVPTCSPCDGGVRNINTVHKKGNTWLVTYETLHPSTGWIADRKEISPAISGWNSWGGTIDVRWHKL